MYVCLCNGVTDRQLVEAAAGLVPSAESPRSSAEDVADRLGVGLGCGSCREFALDFVERAATGRASVVLADRAPSDVISDPRLNGEPRMRATA